MIVFLLPRFYYEQFNQVYHDYSYCNYGDTQVELNIMYKHVVKIQAEREIVILDPS